MLILNVLLRNDGDGENKSQLKCFCSPGRSLDSFICYSWIGRKEGFIFLELYRIRDNNICKKVGNNNNKREALGADRDDHAEDTIICCMIKQRDEERRQRQDREEEIAFIESH